VNMGDKMLSVTSRDNGDDPKILEELTFRTIKAWLWIAGHLEQGVYKLPDNPGSVESRYAAEINAAHVDTDAPPKEPFTFRETFGDARVTCWDTFKSNKRVGFHLNSDDDLQVAVNTWLANQNAVKRAYEELASPQQKVSEKRVEPSNSSAPYNPEADRPATPRNTPQTPVQAVEGAIVATRAPSKNRQYADGQLLIFSINKIVKGTNKGSVTYNLWGDLGKNYALKTVYMTKSGSDEKSQDYIASRDVLEGLNLSVDAGKIETHGNWQLVTKVAHGKNGKGEETEFFNVQSLTAI